MGKNKIMQGFYEIFLSKISLKNLALKDVMFWICTPEINRTWDSKIHQHLLMFENYQERLLITLPGTWKLISENLHFWKKALKSLLSETSYF